MWSYEVKSFGTSIFHTQLAWRLLKSLNSSRDFSLSYEWEIKALWTSCEFEKAEKRVWNLYSETTLLWISSQVSLTMNTPCSSSASWSMLSGILLLRSFYKSSHLHSNELSEWICEESAIFLHQNLIEIPHLTNKNHWRKTLRIFFSIEVSLKSLNAHWISHNWWREFWSKVFSWCENFSCWINTWKKETQYELSLSQRNSSQRKASVSPTTISSSWDLEIRVFHSL